MVIKTSASVKAALRRVKRSLLPSLFAIQREQLRFAKRVTLYTLCLSPSLFVRGQNLLMSVSELTNSGEGKPSGTSAPHLDFELSLLEIIDFGPPSRGGHRFSLPFFKRGWGDFISISFRQNARRLKALPSSAACIPCSVPIKELKLLAPPPGNPCYT